VGFFRSTLDNDIAFINSVTSGRAFFANIGATRRQGVDVGAQLKTDRWLAYIAYTQTDATFQSGFVEASGSNPIADADGNITVRVGNQSRSRTAWGWPGGRCVCRALRPPSCRR
jgi:iron complex outermembrane recepter protein